MINKKRYIYVKGKKITVSEEIYKAYKKQVNHEDYLNRLDRKYKNYGFDDHGIDIESVVDDSVDIEKIIETKMRIEDLNKALERLNKDERELINALYFEERTLKEMARKSNTNLMKISRIRDKILRKLKDMLD